MPFSLERYLTALPASEIANDVNEAISSYGAVVVTAPLGAGKSTLLPLTIHNAHPSATDRILLLEARRIAARQIAERMSQMTVTHVWHRTTMIQQPKITYTS